MKNLLFAMIAVLSLSSVSKADFVVEPFLGYSIASEYKTGSIKDDYPGFDLGARAGLTFTLFSFGVEYAKGTYTAKLSPDVDIDTTDIGAFVAVDFPVLVRAYATYFFDSKGSPSSGSDITGDGGYRLGIGFKGLPLVSINLEIVKRSYDKQGSASVSGDTTNTQLGVSIPLSF